MLLEISRIYFTNHSVSDCSFSLDNDFRTIYRKVAFTKSTPIDSFHIDYENCYCFHHQTFGSKTGSQSTIWVRIQKDFWKMCDSKYEIFFLKFLFPMKSEIKLVVTLMEIFNLFFFKQFIWRKFIDIQMNNCSWWFVQNIMSNVNILHEVVFSSARLYELCQHYDFKISFVYF